MQRWTRVLWTTRGERLLPDRRLYRAREGLSDQEKEIEAHAKAVIIEVAAAALVIRPLLTTGSQPKGWQERRIAEIITGRGPEFAHKWLSRTILHKWLAATGRTDEQEEWDAFADKTTLVRALTEDIADPLTQLERFKQGRDTLSDKAIAARTGWSGDRIKKELPPGVRKKIATTYEDPLAGLDRLTARLDQVQAERLIEYTGWSLKKVREVFTRGECRKIALERSDPVREAVVAIAQAYDFLQDNAAVAQCCGWAEEQTATRFTDTVRRTLSRRARPITMEPSSDPQNEDASDKLYHVKTLVRTTAARFDFLHNPLELAQAIGWSVDDVKKYIAPVTIMHLALKGGDFSAALDKLRRDLTKVSDSALASRFDTSEDRIRAEVPWNLRQHCLVDQGKNPVKALEQWWRGEKRIAGWRRPRIP